MTSASKLCACACAYKKLSVGIEILQPSLHCAVKDEDKFKPISQGQHTFYNKGQSV